MYLDIFFEPHDWSEHRKEIKGSIIKPKSFFKLNLNRIV